MNNLTLRRVAAMVLFAMTMFGQPALAEADAAKPRLVLSWNSLDVPMRVRRRVESLLARASSLEILSPENPCAQSCREAPLQLEIGEQIRDLSTHPLSHQASESFGISAEKVGKQTRIKVTGHERGLLYGTYTALEALGYRFWHPLQAQVPQQVTIPAPFVKHEAPRMPIRGFAHHTMHPLELAHVLNGWGPKGPADEAGWEALLPEWESYLEWLIANRQNKVEWVLLEKAPWAEFARSPERQARLRQLVELGHDWRMLVGMDAPLSLEQQNGWRLIPKGGTPDEELRQLRSSIDWLAATGIDFLTTEMGTSEFTHGGGAKMLSWLNTATDHLAAKGLPFYTKIHISSGQTTEDFKDPETGAPLNINYVPYYADPRLGIMAHTVQIYALDDPAPTYGHRDFSDMHRFMRLNAGKRTLIWFPETAYWVNYDIHVPLFLPVYARQRLHDLRLLAAEGTKLDGQIIFSSGWEHGYWLNDLISARAAWDAQPEAKDDRAAMAALLDHQFAVYGDTAAPLRDLLLDAMDAQHRLLVLGEVDGKKPENPDLRNGIAYLAGQDAWSLLGGTIRALGLSGYQTQPDRIHFEALEKDPQARAFYSRQVAPLLTEIVYDFSRLALRAEALAAKVSPELRPWQQEVAAGLRLNALRARMVHDLMEAAAARGLGQPGETRARLDSARDALETAEQLVAGQVAAYRADPDRIAGWNIPNPTVYRYGYLWPARSLFFWKRDWLSVAQGNYHPCYLNIIDPLEVALPNPGGDGRAGLARGLGPALGLGECLHPAAVPDLRLPN